MYHIIIQPFNNIFISGKVKIYFVFQGMYNLYAITIS